MKDRRQKRALNHLVAQANTPLLSVLEPWVVDTDLGEMLKHPLVYELCVRALPGQANEYYLKKRNLVLQMIRAGDWAKILPLYERPYRMAKLEWLWRRRKIDLDTMRRLLAHEWVDTEMPERNQGDPLWLFREAGFTTDDPRGWASQTDTLMLYRGVDWDFELTREGPSWTLDAKIASFFANRLGGDKRGGTVFGYLANKAEALGYFTGRNESEVILDFENVSSPDDITVISGPGRPMWSLGVGEKPDGTDPG